MRVAVRAAIAEEARRLAQRYQWYRPIKPGTARRLGLRPPTPPLHGIIRCPPTISDEQFEAFKTAFEDGHRSGRWEVTRLDEPPSFHPPVRRRLGLKWWQREAR